MTSTTVAVRTIGHWVDGAEETPDGARTSTVYNPATGEVAAHLSRDLGFPQND